MWALVDIMEITKDISKRTKYRNAIWQSYTSPGCVSQGLWLYHGGIYLHICVYCCTIHSSQEVTPAYRSINRDRIKKMWYTDTKKNEVMTFIGKWCTRNYYAKQSKLDVISHVSNLNLNYLCKYACTCICVYMCTVFVCICVLCLCVCLSITFSSSIYVLMDFSTYSISLLLWKEQQ